MARVRRQKEDGENKSKRKENVEKRERMYSHGLSLRSQLAADAACYLPKKQHQTLNEALEIVVLGYRSLGVQRDVTEYLRDREKREKGRAAKGHAPH